MRKLIYCCISRVYSKSRLLILEMKQYINILPYCDTYKGYKSACCTIIYACRATYKYIANVFIHVNNVHTVDKKYINIVYYLGLSQKSAEVIIMCAFGAHMIKEVTRSQMTSALKFFSGPRHLQKSDKS